MSRGASVLDVAGGTADLARLFAERAGETGRVILTDINGAMLSVGRDRMLNEGKLLPAVQCDAEALPFAARSFDCVSIAFGLRNVTRKDAALAEMRRVLKPGGVALILEFSQIWEPLRPVYDWYSFNVLPRLGRLVAGDEASYRYLAESIRMHPDQATLKTMMETAGLERVEWFNLAARAVALHRGYAPLTAPATDVMQAIAPAIGLANRVLEREDWARERLSAHAGRSVRMICGPMASTLEIAPSGMVSPARDAADMPPSLTLSVSPQRLPTLLAHPERWTQLVDAEGDAALAATIADLARTLPWFVEQAFASALGPLIATGVADAGRALLALPEQAAKSFGASLTSYVRDEAELGVDATRLVDFSAAVAAIAARVDALALRLDQATDTASAKATKIKKTR